MAQRGQGRSGYVKIAGSARSAPAWTRTETLSAEEVLDVTVRVRGKKNLSPGAAPGKRLSRGEFEKRYGASDRDISAVEQFAHENHLAIVESSSARKSVILRGKVKDVERAFAVHLACYRDDAGTSYRCRTGEISIPKSLEGIVQSVHGLDNRPLARPMFRAATKRGMFVNYKASPGSFTPDALASLYGFPAATGKGECIGIIELGGGYRANDLEAYFQSLNIPLPSVIAVSVDGGVNSPSTSDSADGEVMLDIEVAGAVSPGAAIVVYFAPNTDKGFLDAITTAIHDTRNSPGVISISWGSAESRWTPQSLQSFNDAFSAAATLGVTVCAAAGDQGSSDSETDGKAHADFPSSSPFVLACGGTQLTVKGSAIQSEVVWHEAADSATGGGVSDVFPLPEYQKKAGVPPSVSTGFKGRGIPDVAGDADPQTGYRVLVDGQEMVIGGTSAVAPLMAALIARVNQVKGKTAGFIHPALYANPKDCRDITQGDNVTTADKQRVPRRARMGSVHGMGRPVGSLG